MEKLLDTPRASGCSRSLLSISGVEKFRPQLEAYEGFCREIERAPADVALAWVMSNPGVTAPIVGPRTIEQLDGSIKVLDLKLSDDQLARLDEIWPGPGNQAPEAYAW